MMFNLFRPLVISLLFVSQMEAADDSKCSLGNFALSGWDLLFRRFCKWDDGGAGDNVTQDLSMEGQFLAGKVVGIAKVFLRIIL